MATPLWGQLLLCGLPVQHHMWTELLNSLAATHKIMWTGAEEGCVPKDENNKIAHINFKFQKRVLLLCKIISGWHGCIQREDTKVKQCQCDYVLVLKIHLLLIKHFGAAKEWNIYIPVWSKPVKIWITACFISALCIYSSLVWW